jgi:hypothetical protein
MSTQLKCDFICYDYSDSLTDYKTLIKESELLADFIEVIRFLQNLNKANIILISNSIGSIPVLNFLITHTIKIITGIILISPIGFVFKEIENKEIFDRLNKITHPVFIIHGKKDQIVNYRKSVNMATSIKNLFEWYPNSADHYNLFSKYRAKFYTKVKFFMNQVHIFTKKAIEFENFTQKIKNDIILNCTKNISFKFEDNYIVKEQNFFERIDDKETINFSFSKNIEDVVKSFPDHEIFEKREKVIFSADNNLFLRRSTCSSIKDISQRNLPNVKTSKL